MILKLKYIWYKYVRRLDMVGFFMGIPVIRTKYLVSESHNERKEVGNGKGHSP